MESRYDRPYYEDTGNRPFLYYAIFGAGDEQLNISSSRHRVESFPRGLELTAVQRPEHSGYMDALLGGTLGEVLKRQNAKLYQAALESQRWAILQGEVQDDRDLGYLRDSIGVVQAAVESGAVGVLDLETLSLFSPSDWTGRVFAHGLELPRSHVVILISSEGDGSLWLHTRGMRKFGRPDIGMEQVPEKDSRQATAAVNQMIFYSALGAVFPRPARLHIGDGLVCQVHPELTGSLDDPDFNNTHYRILWPECILTPEEEQSAPPEAGAGESEEVPEAKTGETPEC